MLEILAEGLDEKLFPITNLRFGALMAEEDRLIAEALQRRRSGETV